MAKLAQPGNQGKRKLSWPDQDRPAVKLIPGFDLLLFHLKSALNFSNSKNAVRHTPQFHIEGTLRNFKI